LIDRVCVLEDLQHGRIVEVRMVVAGLEQLAVASALDDVFDELGEPLVRSMTPPSSYRT
jgi:hypothetical protein